MNLLSRFMRGEGVSARVLRSSSIIALSFAATQAMRLGSNLVLTRILFPEAFGLMALVTVFIVGLQMFSDTGIGPSILQNARGDEPDFLNTAWTLQILRGVVLWFGTFAIAFPAAWLYSEPMLAQLLPVAGIALLIGSFNPTRGETAFRHLRAVRVVLMDLAAQALGILSVILLAWWFESVWALVFGAHVSAVAKLVLMNRYLTGHRDRWHLNRRDALDILHFGKWIFLASISGFFVNQGDKAVLGSYLTLAALGIYNIGYTMGSLPLQVANAIIPRVLIPLYREANPSECAANARKVRHLRFLLSGATLSLQGLFAIGGVALIDFLYDPRYDDAGAIVVLIACAQMLGLVSRTYDQAALAYGDSRGFCFVVTIRAVLQTALLWAGAHFFGVVGALAGQGIALLAVHLPTILLARKHKVWDPLHDVIIIGGAFALSTTAIWLHRDAILALASATGQ